jgi:hypothetical protein
MVGGGFDNYGLCGLAMVKPELSPLFATLTPQIAVSPLFATLSKIGGGGARLFQILAFGGSGRSWLRPMISEVYECLGRLLWL